MTYSKMFMGAFVLMVGFIGFGDRILSGSLADYSVTAREHVMGMLPTIRPQNRDSKTEQAIESLGQ